MFTMFDFRFYKESVYKEFIEKLLYYLFIETFTLETLIEIQSRK